jgi:hypothetical protein
MKGPDPQGGRTGIAIAMGAGIGAAVGALGVLALPIAISVGAGVGCAIGAALDAQARGGKK